MKYIVSVALLLGLGSSIFSWTNPCGINGVHVGAVVQRSCQDLAGTCSWPILPNYTKDKTCQFWCCYDVNGHYLNYALSDCGAETSNGCCNGLDPGTVVDRPTCPPNIDP